MVAQEETQHWFDANGWTIFQFQQAAWDAWHRGESGLIHSSTGSGKTLAAWLGPLQSAASFTSSPEGLQVLWITPLRALAGDTAENLKKAAQAIAPQVRVDVRTGDTASGNRAKQLKDPPYCLITTPESLSVLLASGEQSKLLQHLTTIVVDEWHELMASKRGVQLELCLSHLKTHGRPLKIWGLSATLGNLTQAMSALLGPESTGTLIKGTMDRVINVESLLPPSMATFPWSGHLGLQLIEPVIEAIENATTTLVFTNTRSQTELWFKALLEARPHWVTTLAIHHGSIDRTLREDAENRLRSGQLTCVVCTSSLDLGIDFSPVDQVLQVGSPKGIARLMQRAGRSGHQPGAPSRILCVPTHAFELIEIAAIKKALKLGRIEAKPALTRSLDVLCQHLVTIALGAGFRVDAMRQEVQATAAFTHLSDAEWNWVMDFITRGGQALKGYPQYHKVVDVAGVHRVMNKEIGQRHRLNIGTITSDAQIQVSYRGGKRIGSTEEQFISKIRPGQSFHFAGLHLELLHFKDTTAYVKKATKRGRAIPKWGGIHMPLSTELSDSVLEVLQDWKTGMREGREIEAVEPLLNMQQQWSHLPGPNELLIEQVETTEGYSLFCYPFAGRLAHEGLAMLAAHRLTLTNEATYNLQANDYGFELESEQPIDVDEQILQRVLSPKNLLEDILGTVNSSELAKRRFRSIARISGLVFEGYPGRSKTARQVQSSSGLIYDVLMNHDDGNLLLQQAKREVLEAQLDYHRMHQALVTLHTKRWFLRQPARLTPLSFPLWAESLQGQVLSNESFTTRVERMLVELEAATVETLDQA